MKISSARLPRRPLLIAVFILLAFSALPRVTEAALIVDCSRPRQTIGQRLVSTAKTLTIVVKGVCTENLVIARDDVTITTDGVTPATITAADTTKPTVLLDGAHRVIIDGRFTNGMTVSGGANGLYAGRGSTLDLTNCRVTGNTGYSVVSSHGSTTTMNNCSIGPITENGALAADGASLVITSSTVTGNTGYGVAGVRNSTMRLRTVTVTGSGLDGVVLSHASSAWIEDSTISNNRGNGVSVFQGSSLRIGTTLVSANSLSGLNVSAGSNTELWGGASITQNGDSSGWRAGIGIYQGSSVVIIASQTDHVFANKGPGIFLSNSSSLLLKEGLVESNAGDGVSINSGSTAQFDVSATIIKNSGYGVGCHDPQGTSNLYGPRPGDLSQNGSGETNCSLQQAVQQPARTFAVCVNGAPGSPNYCSCGGAKLLSFNRTDTACTVTSDTGSCLADAYLNENGLVESGSCCVCAP